MSEWHDVATPDPSTHVAKHLRSQCSAMWCGQEPLLPGGDVPVSCRYENTLKWIATLAWGHYFGAAFEPEHMRAISNIAAGALAGRELPDHDEAMTEAREHARVRADKWAKMFEDDEREGTS